MSKLQNHLNNTNCYQDSQVYLYISPLVTEFKVSSRSVSSGRVQAKRGKIKGFSSKSRGRLIKLLMSLEKLPAVMVTLTYPEKWPEDPKRWKRDLEVWWKRVKRRFEDPNFIWKLEFQKRGAPHFHLLGSFGDGVEVNKELMEWVSKTWYEVVGSGDEKHLKAGTRVDVLDSKKKIRMYVCKYISKEEALKFGCVGRWWGKLGNVPSVVKLAVGLQYKEAVLVRRILKRWLRSIRLKSGKRSRYYYWVKKHFRSPFSVFLDWVSVIKLLKFVIPYPIEFLQVRPLVDYRLIL